MGLPGLKIDDQRRVSKDNCACRFVLDEQQKIIDRGGGAIRENPNNSLHDICACSKVFYISFLAHA